MSLDATGEVISQAGSQSCIEETRQRIIEAAIHVFSEKGYAGATTRAIAAEARVNEVTIFRHFGKKEKLFWAAVDHYSVLPGLETMIEQQFTGDYRQDLIYLSNFFVFRLTERYQTTERRKILLMMLQEVDRRPEMRKIILPMFGRIRQLLKEYFGQQVDRGRVQNLDPEVMAEAILGMFFSYVLLHPLLTETLAPESAPEVWVGQFVDIFVQGTVCSQNSSGKT